MERRFCHHILLAFISTRSLRCVFATPEGEGDVYYRQHVTRFEPKILRENGYPEGVIDKAKASSRFK